MAKPNLVEQSYNLQPWYFKTSAYQFNHRLNWYALYTNDKDTAERMRDDIVDALRRVKEQNKI